MSRKGKGHSKGAEHFTKMIRQTMEEPAWKALSPLAQALYPWLKLEWRGPDFNNNGKIRLSVRQAAERLGVGINTAARGFHDLQGKGFILVTEHACLGVDGMARAPAYELTELAVPNSGQRDGHKSYRQWRPGKDFPVIRHSANNPYGRNGKFKNPSSKPRRTCLKNDDVRAAPVINMKTSRHQNSDVGAQPDRTNVTVFGTSLSTRPYGENGVPDLSVTAGLGLCPLLASHG